jgi:hypothetical protein
MLFVNKLQTRKVHEIQLGLLMKRLQNPYLEKLSEEINTLSNRLKFRIISERQEWHDNNDCRPLQALGELRIWGHSG